jgi:PAP2 superfamily
MTSRLLLPAILLPLVALGGDASDATATNLRGGSGSPRVLEMSTMSDYGGTGTGTGSSGAAATTGTDGVAGPAGLLHYYPNDLGLRFNKIPWVDPDNIPPDVSLPLTIDSYPLLGDVATILQLNSMAHTVMGGVAAGDYECQGQDVMEYIQLLGGPPPMPSSNPNARFWHELCQVVTAQEQRRANASATEYWGFLPAMWPNYTLPQVADAVHIPVLGTHHTSLIIGFDKAGLQMDAAIVPVRGKRDFIGREIRLMEILNWSVGKVAAVNFWIKWYVGRQRPEEIAWKIATGELTTTEHGVPEGLAARVKALELEHAENFTAFPEGCPPHPSWPAMHAASSATSLWLPVVANLTPEQYCEVLRLDFAVAMARTVAGVHYTEDNYAGLQFGQEFIARQLPTYLAERFGSNATAVEAKVKTLRFDWKTFNPIDCTFGSKYSYELPCTA